MENSRSEKINISKRKHFCLLLFSFIAIYYRLLRRRPARGAPCARVAAGAIALGSRSLWGARRRGGRAAEGARLESVYAGNRIAGSNPAPSATICVKYLISLNYFLQLSAYTQFYRQFKLG